MSYASLLDHDVVVERRHETGESDYGLPVTEPAEVVVTRAAIQPKSAREVAAYHQAGVALADHTIFVGLPDVHTADVIVHTAADCGKADGFDLPDGRYELSGVRNAVGRGHHIECDARLIQPAIAGIDA